MAMRAWLLLATCLLQAVSLVHSFNYIGCFADSGSRDLPVLAGSSSAMSVGRCNTMCGSRNYKYFGVQYSKECWCGNSYGKYGSRARGECNMRCSGDRSTFCGAGWRNSVYASDLTPGMSFVGCFLDTSRRDLPVLAARGAMRIARCYQVCRQRKYAYFGAQNGDECWCGNSFGSHGVRPSRECSKHCSADRSATCGAGWRNSVYTTGLKPADSLSGSHHSSTLRGQLQAAIKSQAIAMPHGVVCYNCLISAWRTRHADVKSKVFPFRDLDSFVRSYPSKVRDKLQVLKFGANAKVTFDDSKIDINRDHAVRKSYVGMARRVQGGNVEFGMVSAEVVASVVAKHNVHRRRVCRKILWFKRCRTVTSHHRRGLHTNEIRLIDQAMRSETFRLFAEKSHLVTV